MVTTVREDVFDTTDSGETVRRFTLDNGNGLSVQLINYGATITSIKIDGTDVALGYDDMAGYTSRVTRNPYFGAVVGRVANRIADGKFSLDGKEYSLAQNNGPNALHDGLKGLDKVMWNAFTNQADGSVVFTYLSHDGDEGYPGDVLYNVKYSLGGGSLQLDFSGAVTAPTPVNMVNHVYFNLAGHKAGADGLNEHVMKMNAAHYTPVSDKLIPTGEIAPVQGTVFDLRQPTRLGDVLGSCPGGENNGFDHNFVVAGPAGQINMVSRVECPVSGIWLECWTDQPGCQFYTGNFVPKDDSLKGKEGAVYRKHGGFCLETQKFPDSVNQPHFPTCIVRPGSLYKHHVAYKFGKM